MRRISILGLVAVCAMAFTAITASGAAAATAVETGNTAFTCIEGAGAHNTNSDCQPGSTGNFGHVAIAEGEETGLQLTKLTNPQLSVTIGLVPTVLTATGVECKNCMAHNQTAGGVMDVTGSGGTVLFTGVTTNVNHCAVVGGQVETKPLKVTTLSPTKAALESTVAEEIMAEFSFENSGGTCPLVPNNPIKVKGHADGTLSGAKVTFNTGAGELTVGTQTAHLTGEATVTAGVTGGAFHAVALTAA